MEYKIKIFNEEIIKEINQVKEEISTIKEKENNTVRFLIFLILVV
jgi:hypothetical protein